MTTGVTANVSGQRTGAKSLYIAYAMTAEPAELVVDSLVETEKPTESRSDVTSTPVETPT